MDGKNSFLSDGKYILHNSVEDKVMEKAREIMSKMDMCQCEKCFVDVCAMALNKMMPIYVTTAKGSLIAKVPQMDHDNEIAMAVTVTRCAKMVNERPMH